MTTLFVCLAPALMGPVASGYAPDSRGRWHELPIRLASGAVFQSKPVLPALLDAQSYGPNPDRLGSLCLLFAACTCLALLEVKLHRRNSVDDRRAAETLAGALRSGALEFGERVPGALPVWQTWIDTDEPESEPVTRALVPSLYHKLGHGQPEPADRTSTVEPSVRMITAPDPFRIVSDEELLLGIRRELIRPRNERARFDYPALDKPWQQLPLDASAESEAALD